MSIVDCRELEDRGGCENSSIQHEVGFFASSTNFIFLTPSRFFFFVSDTLILFRVLQETNGKGSQRK